jgi:Domain of unknown function (DUF4920)
MKRLLLTLLIAATATAFAGDVVTRGAAISKDTKTVPLAKVMETPQDFIKEPIVVEGLVETACQNKGCWMQIVPEAGQAGMRVTFKDYGFFVPKDSKGRQAKMEGTVAVKTLSKQEADHLSEEGAKLNRNADGTANEVSFVATGVELRTGN